MRPKFLSVSELTGAIVRSVFSVGHVDRMPLVPDLLCGVEIEAEQASIDDNINLYELGWGTHVDHSLRDGIEFVLNDPLAGDKLAWAIEGLYNAMPEELEFSPNPRAGTHVHINVSDRSMAVVQAMFTLMYALDRLVFEWAGDDRLWCSYCNSLNTLPPNTLRTLLRDDDRSGWYKEMLWPNNNSDRYYGFNVTSLFKYGTVEFRYFPTTTSKDKMWEWLDFCQLVFKYADSLPVVDDVPVAQAVLNDIRSEEPLLFLRRVFGDSSAVLAGLTAGDNWQQNLIDAVDELSTLLSIDDRGVEEEQDMSSPGLSYANLFDAVAAVDAAVNSPTTGRMYTQSVPAWAMPVERAEPVVRRSGIVGSENQATRLRSYFEEEL